MVNLILSLLALSSGSPGFTQKSTGTKSNFQEVTPVTNQILVVRFRDGYVEHHKVGTPRSAEIVHEDPLDIGAAMNPKTFTISAKDDSSYAIPRSPMAVGRKSKGVDFAWFVDRWVGDHAENDRPDHVDEHWIYLYLPKPLISGKTYSLNLGGLAKETQTVAISYDELATRSDTVHVNLLGYAPDSPSKYGYIYQWMGDKGNLDLSQWKDKPFQLVDANGKSVFAGKVAFRKSVTNVETGLADDTPHQNFLGAEVYECDFSSFKTPGKYRLSVAGIGASRPFSIDPDVYREAFRITARGLYHNRSGIALTKPYTDYERPAPHNPMLTPGFAGKLQYTTSRCIDWTNADASPADKPAIEKGLKGPINVAGWYQDAGDWDSYITHFRVAQELLTAFQLAPTHFQTGELTIPESNDGLPDILNEAAWLPRFGYRLRHELLRLKYGTGGIGMRVAGDHFGGDESPDGKGQGSWQDTHRTWIVSGEDPVSTLAYAGAAAHLALCLKMIGKPDPEKVDWRNEATESYAWAMANSRPGDSAKGEYQEWQGYAAANLFALTGDKRYETGVELATKSVKADSLLYYGALGGSASYVLNPNSAKSDPELYERLRSAILATAEMEWATSEKRALRWGGDFNMPMLIGQQTTPWAEALMVGYEITKGSDPAMAKKYLGAIYTTCDYFLGTNSLNQTWVTGLGPKYPEQVFHMDGWYNGKPNVHPGVIPYGPWRKSNAVGKGPWDSDWANKSVYPGIDEWPGNERWFNNRCSPLSGEFTIHQNTAPAAAIFGYLCAPRK